MGALGIKINLKQNIMKTVYYFTQNNRPAMLVELFGIKFHVYFEDNEIVGVEAQWYDVESSEEASKALEGVSIDLETFLDFFENKRVYGHVYYDNGVFQVNTRDNTCVLGRFNDLKEARIYLATCGVQTDDNCMITTPFTEVRCL